jgi:hypothetical protein
MLSVVLLLPPYLTITSCDPAPCDGLPCHPWSCNYTTQALTANQLLSRRYATLIKCSDVNRKLDGNCARSETACWSSTSKVSPHLLTNEGFAFVSTASVAMAQISMILIPLEADSDRRIAWDVCNAASNISCSANFSPFRRPLYAFRSPRACGTTQGAVKI